MYEAYWQLSARPFENHVEQAQYYPSETHQAAMLKLRYAIENRRAAALLCGPCGMGKTLVVDGLLRQLDDCFRPAQHLVFPALDSQQLLRYLVGQLDSPGSRSPQEAAADLQAVRAVSIETISRRRHVR